VTFALVFLAIIMATVIGWLLRQTLNTQPWEANDPLENQPGRGVINTDPAKIGLLSFIAVVTSLFALFLSAYMMRMRLGDWRPVDEPDLLWLNTAVLVLASVAFQLTRGAARRGQPLTVKVGLLVGGACTTLFLFGQLMAWQQLNASGFFMTGNPANAFFLPAYRIAWSAFARRPVGMGQNDSTHFDRRRCGECSPERGIVHRVLALPAARMDWLVRFAVIYIEG